MADGKTAFCQLDTVSYSDRTWASTRLLRRMHLDGVKRYVSYFIPRDMKNPTKLGVICWWNDAKPSNPTDRKRKGLSNRRPSIKANSPAAFYPDHQSDWWWDSIDPLQTFRLYLFCIPAKRWIWKETHFGKKKKQPSLSLNAYALTHGCLDGLPIQLLRRLALRIKIKAVSNVPVGRLAALWKQAFMCSGWQAFDVSSRVWD